jgi:hypothetical protein
LLTSGVTGLDKIAESDGKSERSTGRSQMDLTKESLFFRHLMALTRKRAANFSRDKKAWFCTTLLPSSIVLIGLLLTTFLPTNRNLQPITLDFKEFNPDVTTEPKNPISYNNPTNPYSCSPGFCSYVPQLVEIEETNEIYGFCGYTANALDADPTISKTCSNAVSNEIMQFLGSGATGQEKDVIDITNVSVSERFQCTCHNDLNVFLTSIVHSLPLLCSIRRLFFKQVSTGQFGSHRIRPLSLLRPTQAIVTRSLQTAKLLHLK